MVSTRFPQSAIPPHEASRITYHVARPSGETYVCCTNLQFGASPFLHPPPRPVGGSGDAGVGAGWDRAHFRRADRAGGGGRAHPAGCPGAGDAALHEWAQRIDRRPPGPLEVPAAGVARGVRASTGGTAVGVGSGRRTHRSLPPEAADVFVGGGGAGRHAGPTDPAAGSRRRLRPRRHRPLALRPC